MNQTNITLGDLVRIKEKSPAGGGELAYVYDTYADFDEKGEVGISLITESGHDTGGWSRAEQLQYIEYVSRVGWDYEFKNVIQLDHDFRDGVFDRAFKK